MFLISLNRRSSCQWSRVLQTCAGLSLPWVQMLGVNPPNIFSPEHVKCCVALSLCHLRQERMASGEQNLAGESAAVRLAKQHFWCQNVPTYSMDFPWISHGFPMDFPWISHGFPMNFPWISHEFPMDFPWISHGFPMDFHEGSRL